MNQILDFFNNLCANFQFCAVACSALLILLFLGRSVSGIVLLYLTTMAAILLPGVCIHLLPPDTLDKFEVVKSKIMGLKSALLNDDKGEKAILFKVY